jgi:hypothetical protein
MLCSVAIRTERNEIGFGIFSAVTSELLMMNFQIRHRTTRLASPGVSAEYPLALSFV